MLFNVLESKFVKNGGPEQSALNNDPIEKKSSKIFVALRKITMVNYKIFLEIFTNKNSDKTNGPINRDWRIKKVGNKQGN